MCQKNVLLWIKIEGDFHTRKSPSLISLSNACYFTSSNIFLIEATEFASPEAS